MKFVYILAVVLIVQIVGQKLSDLENAVIQQECGKKGMKLKVMFGIKTTTNEAPFAVSVEVHKRYGIFHCSGTFVSPRHVISARHCFVNDFKDGKFTNVLDGQEICKKGCIEKDFLMPKNTFKAKLHFGTSCRNPKICEKAGLEQHLVTRFPKKVFLPGICAEGSGDRHDDIAIIELDREVGFSERIHPACLPMEDFNLEHGAELTTFGFGLDPSDHQIATGLLRRELTATKNCQLGDFVCSVSSNGDQLACKGDSGAGSLFTFKNRTTLAAVLSRGEECKTHLKYYADFVTPIRRYAKEICKYTGYCNLRQQPTQLLSTSHLYRSESPLIHNSGPQEFVGFVFLVFTIVIIYQFTLYTIIFG